MHDAIKECNFELITKDDEEALQLLSFRVTFIAQALNLFTQTRFIMGSDHLFLMVSITILIRLKEIKFQLNNSLKLKR